MLDAEEKREWGPPFLLERPKQWDSGPAAIPTEPIGGDEVDQQVGSVRRQVHQAAARETRRKGQGKERRKGERDARCDQNAVSKAVMECVQVTAKTKAEEKIEVGGIGDKHEQDDWGR